MKMTTSGTEINKNHRGASVNKTAEMTRMALMVAMNCVSAYIIIPLPFSWHISEAKNTASSVTLCLAALSVFR